MRLIAGMTGTTTLLIAASLGAAVIAVPSTAKATAPGIPFAPHRAVYEMRLDESGSGKDIAGVEGRMVFDISGSPCAGYTLQNRMVTRIVDAEGVEVVSDIRSSTWEDGNGETFRFNSSQYLNNRLTENLEGEATRDPQNDRIEVVLKTPKAQELQVDADAQFPTQFSLKILEAARNGERVFQARVYDGSESGDKLFATTTFIGEETPPGEENAEMDVPAHTRLKSLRSWPVSISYFDRRSREDSTPSYQLSFQLYENGVSRKLRIDYGAFALKGQLSSLQFHDDAEACQQKPG